MTSFLERASYDLNDKQLEAVVQTEGPLLILAGAGSGKTRVLTYRIAHLIYDHGVDLSAILAMTFSNKAAREMHDRVKVLLGDSSQFRLPWISTFHSVSARILRMYGSRLGYKQDYAIYDESDQLSMIKTCIEKLSLEDRLNAADSILRRIGDWKNQGKFAEDIQGFSMTSFDEVCSQVYTTYTEEMKNAQAMDFDDLLLNTYRLFRDETDIREHFQNQWRYVLIDEFQDTNELQYKLLKLMVHPSRNLCVVGDDDQSIYGWRGAKIENILKFDKEFSDAKVIKLEQNYRSTSTILKAAAQVISKNEMRHEKTLWTEQGPGERIRLISLVDDRMEAGFVVSEIKQSMQRGISPEEIAVLYRVNSLSRGFEEECLRQRLPYRIIGGFRFYERKEIKDILSYLKILMNPSDIMAFRRSVNTPARGIGKASVEKLEENAALHRQSIVSYLIQENTLPLTGKAKNGIQSYRELLQWGTRALKGSESLADLVLELLERSAYVKSLEAEKSEENIERIENIKEFMSAVQEFEETWAPNENAGENSSSDESQVRAKLRDFLERVSLMSDLDQMQEGMEQVTFMSLHAAKGLEFKICFICGMEEGLFPSARSFDSYERTEEERRLCYVGITRAKEKLYLTRAERRRAFGTINFNVPSRFLKDISSELLEATISEEEDESPPYYRPRRAWGSAAKPKEEFDFDFDQRRDDENFTFSKGDRVAHPSFGEGIVQKVELLGEEECLQIVFARKGVKKVLAKFVKACG